MNDERRKRLRTLIDQIDMLGLEEIRDDEQAAFDAQPESLQNSPRGESQSEILDALKALIDGLDEAIADVERTAQLPCTGDAR